MFQSAEKINMNAASGIGSVSYGSDKGLYVEFNMEPIYQGHESEKQGRPVYKEVPFIKIFTPGDKTKILHTPVEEEHKIRFSRQWEAFERQGVNVVEGMPLTEWPPLSRGQVMELKGLGIHTVEALAAVSDTALTWLGARELRKKAQAWLDSANSGANISRMMAEINALQVDNKAMKQQLLEAVTPVAGNDENTEEPKRRGRPPVNKE